MIEAIDRHFVYQRDTYQNMLFNIHDVFVLPASQ